MPYYDPHNTPEGGIVREEPPTGLHAEVEALKKELAGAREVLAAYDEKYDALQAAYDALKAKLADESSAA